MRIAVAGNIYGRITERYERLAGQRIDWVLVPGNFGVWPDPMRASRQSRKQGTGEFLDYLVGKKNIPIPTLMVGGKQEDHWWLHEMVKRGDAELIQNLHFLVNGNKTFLDDLTDTIHVLGLGGTYSPKPSRNKGQYSMKEVSTACMAGPIDILLTHEAPDGVQFGTHTSTAKGINKVCFATRPRLLIHGKYDEPKIYKTPQTLTYAICPGNGDIILEITTKNIDILKSS